MTKVKAIKNKKAGKSPASLKETSALSSSKLINAERNGQTRTFTPLLWDNLPPDKDGWKESLGKPEELNVNNSEPVKPEVTKPASEENSGADDSDEDDDDSNMIDHIVTQEDLDLNPELATAGTKVGDTVKITKEGGVE